MSSAPPLSSPPPVSAERVLAESVADVVPAPVTTLTVKPATGGCSKQFFLSPAQLNGVLQSAEHSQPLIDSMVQSWGKVAFNACKHNDCVDPGACCMLCDPEQALFHRMIGDLTFVDNDEDETITYGCIACESVMDATRAIVRVINPDNSHWVDEKFMAADNRTTRDGMYAFCTSCIETGEAHGVCSVCLTPLVMEEGKAVCRSKTEVYSSDEGELEEELGESGVELVGMSPATDTGKCGTWEENVVVLEEEEEEEEEGGAGGGEEVVEEEEARKDESDDDDGKKRHAGLSGDEKKTKRVRTE